MIKVLDFYAEWCQPCQMLMPVLEEFCDTHENLTLEKVNVDQDAASAAKYKVRSLPTLVFEKEGEEVYRTFGAKTKEELETILKSI